MTDGATRAARQHPLLLAAAVLVLGGAVAAGALLVLESSNAVPASAAVNCGTSVSGQGFRVFACMSGGADTGHPHPKELLVVRNDGSSAGYPAFGGQYLAAGDGEVVAVHDLDLVRVTSSRLVPLLTSRELARVLHVQPTAIMGVYHLTVDAGGDVYFVASVLRSSQSGCRNPLVERTAGGRIRLMRASISPDNICS